MSETGRIKVTRVADGFTFITSADYYEVYASRPDEFLVEHVKSGGRSKGDSETASSKEEETSGGGSQSRKNETSKDKKSNSSGSQSRKSETTVVLSDVGEEKPESE